MPPAAAVIPPSLSVGSFVRFGWETFKKRPWFLIGALVLFSIAGWIAGFAVGVTASVLAATIGTGLANVVSFVGTLVVNSLIAMGWIAFFLKAHDDISSVRLADFWHPQNLISYIIVSILYGLIVGVGFLLLIVPGIIAAVTFLFAPYLVVDKGLGPIAALKESARITKENRWRVLALMGATILVTLLGFVALIVGLLVAIPVALLTYIHAYRSLAGAAATGAPRVPISGGEIAFVVAGVLIPFVLALAILSSVVLSSLNAAREKGRAARAESNMKMLQLGVELYREVYGAYPSALTEVVQDPNIWTDSGFFTDDFTYTPLGDSYRLCSKQPTASGQKCVSPDDVGTPTSAQ